MTIERSFEIRRIEPFHLRLGGRSYWESYLDGRAREAARFLTRPRAAGRDQRGRD